MIVCPNCNHKNPEAALQCEACYTDLPSITSCPQCGASIQGDAMFCGNGGFNLQSKSSESVGEVDLSKDENVEISSQEADSVINPTQPREIENSPKQPVEPIHQAGFVATVLQEKKTAKLIHLQTNTVIEIPQNLSVINLGKPNNQFPPDIDVSGFPNSEIVSRIHGRLVVENDDFYIEDLGSSNGTFINHLPLLEGNRHKLKMGDQISLGKEDKVTFLFQLD
jgi:pSer/pThr/pTyr-binding forkhead associated (FHA) protein